MKVECGFLTNDEIYWRGRVWRMCVARCYMSLTGSRGSYVVFGSERNVLIRL